MTIFMFLFVWGIIFHSYGDVTITEHLLASVKQCFKDLICRGWDSNTYPNLRMQGERFK